MREKLKYWWFIFYLPIYMFFFVMVEQKTTGIHWFDFAIDHAIPFCEYFIVPYLLWFPYMAVAILALFFINKKEFVRMAILLFSGMTIFIIVSMVYPNGIHLRPEVYPRDNIFIDMVKALQTTDTPTNVLPSIHVFNSIGAHIGIRRTFKSKAIRWSSGILALLIILSTMFIKQHSVLDVGTGLLMAIVLYILVYKVKKADTIKK